MIKSTGLWYEVNVDGKTKVARLRGKLKLQGMKLTNPIAVGDWVEMVPHNQTADEWVIEEVLPRQNYVIRKSPRKKGFDHILASNIDQGVLIATLKMPRTSTGFIDRFLISLEAFRIPGIIVFNKSDLFGKKERALFDELKSVYEAIGYQVMLSSFIQDSLQDLRAILKNKISLLSGHSGSGKSTLINKLIPGAGQEVNEVSNFANKGVHTTTFAERFEMDEDTAIIDTPGIKELGLSEIVPEELSHFFPEMRAHLGQCKFHNCLHDGEPGCVVRDNVGVTISSRRYESYLSILRGEDNRK